MTILINEKGISIFQLSKKEVRVLNILYRNGPLTLSQLVRATKIPRMTLYPLINKLKDRGFIEREGPNTQPRWFIKSEREIIKLIESFIISEPSQIPFAPSNPKYGNL